MSTSSLIPPNTSSINNTLIVPPTIDRMKTQFNRQTLDISQNQQPNVQSQPNGQFIRQASILPNISNNINNNNSNIISNSDNSSISILSLSNQSSSNKLLSISLGKQLILDKISECMEIINAKNFKIENINIVEDLSDLNENEYNQWIDAKTENINIGAAAQKIKSLYEKQLNEHEEIMWYLDQEIKKKDEILASYTNNQNEINEKKAQIELQYNANWAIEENKLLTELNELEASYATLQAEHIQLASLNDQMVNLEEESQKLQKQIIDVRKDHFKEITDMEHASIDERERLKKEMSEKIKENSKRFERMTEDQLHTTTITTIQMHKSFVEELNIQAEKTENYLAKKNQLKNMGRSLKVELEVHEHTQEMLAERAKELQKSIKSCNASLRNIALEEKKLREKNSTFTGKIFATKAKQDLELQIADIESNILAMENSLEDYNAQRIQLVEEVAKLKAKKSKLISNVDSTMLLMLTCAEDLKGKIRREGKESDENEYLRYQVLLVNELFEQFVKSKEVARESGLIIEVDENREMNVKQQEVKNKLLQHNLDKSLPPIRKLNAYNFLFFIFYIQISTKSSSFMR